MTSPNLIIQQLKSSPIMNNPTMQNAMRMYESGDVQGLQGLVNNICNQRGIRLSDIQKQLQNMNLR